MTLILLTAVGEGLIAVGDYIIAHRRISNYSCPSIWNYLHNKMPCASSQYHFLIN